MRGQRAVATVDIHHLEGGRGVAMVVLDEDAGWTDEQIADLHAALDEEMLPGMDAARGTLTLTTVVGRLVTNHDHEPAAPPARRETRPGRSSKH
ncbi:MAG TPA: hypothetical protein PKE29_07565 [Phycisphaerales bacterium]|nr:hypothetical protein [Phycisphaerales bacterium]